jgi:hypothetical protein
MGKGDDLPNYVKAMSKKQAEHLMVVLKETDERETLREKRSAECPEASRKAMLKAFDRERAAEVLSIQRLREEHAFFLDQALKYGPEGYRGRRKERFVPDSAGVPGLYEDRPVPDRPGTTAQDLAFLKSCYSKLSGDGGREARRHSRGVLARRQTSAAQRMASEGPARHGPGALTQTDRRDLMAQREVLLGRLEELRSAEALATGSGRLTTGRTTGRSAASSHYYRPPLSARSTATSASGATFCDATAPPTGRSDPRVPPLRGLHR